MSRNRKHLTTVRDFLHWIENPDGDKDGNIITYAKPRKDDIPIYSDGDKRSKRNRRDSIKPQ